MATAQTPRRLFAGPEALLALARDILRPEVTLPAAHIWVLATVAGGMGVLADVLFRNTTLGINLPLWLATPVLGLWLAGRRIGVAIDPQRLALLVVAVAMTAVSAWRDSGALTGLSLAAAWGLVLLALALPPGVGLRRISFLTFPIAVAAGCVSFGTGVVRACLRIPWHDHVAPAGRENVVMIGRAVVIATPIILVFGGLFVAADAVFADRVDRALSFGFPHISSHVWWFLGGSWVATTMLWSGLAIVPPADIETGLPIGRGLRVIELGIILGPLAVLFALFVAVQIQYLFGGAEVVQASTALTYAEYARRGFFELVVASLLLLPLLVVANWARRKNPTSGRVFVGLAGALTVLLYVVMASAWQRLNMYIEAFGLTELRFYAAGLLLWLGVVFAWFLVTAARRQPRELSSGATAAAVVALFAAHLVNPDAFIAQTNIERAASGRSFDAQYAASLSSDAVPALINSLAVLSPTDRCALSASLLSAWSGETETDLREWNFSRAQAANLVAKNRATLESACR